MLPKFESLLDFLGILQRNGLLTDKKSPGLVVYADDQMIHQQQMKTHFREVGIPDKLLLFQDGMQVTEYFDFILDDIEESPEEETVQPVTLLLLDINMQPMGGMEALKLVKNKYQQLNSKLNLTVEDIPPIGCDKQIDSARTAHDKVVPPFICYYSQYDYGTMQQFITPEE